MISSSSSPLIITKAHLCTMYDYNVIESKLELECLSSPIRQASCSSNVINFFQWILLYFFHAKRKLWHWSIHTNMSRKSITFPSNWLDDDPCKSRCHTNQAHPFAWSNAISFEPTTPCLVKNPSLCRGEWNRSGNNKPLSIFFLKDSQLAVAITHLASVKRQSSTQLLHQWK